MGFARFMATPTGRILRIVFGLVLLYLGFNVVGGGWGIAIAAFSIVPLLAGSLNFCLIGRLIGAPFWGRDALKSS